MSAPSIAILPEIDSRFLELRKAGLTVEAIAVQLNKGEAWVRKRPALLTARGVVVPPVRIGRPLLDPAATPADTAALRGGDASPKTAKPRKPARAPQPRLAPPHDAPLGLDLFALGAGQCRWPLEGEGLATRFCAAPAPDFEPYCPCHRRRAWGGPGRTLDRLVEVCR